jgi:hypothetical protein
MMLVAYRSAEPLFSSRHRAIAPPSAGASFDTDDVIAIMTDNGQIDYIFGIRLFLCSRYCIE